MTDKTMDIQTAIGVLDPDGDMKFPLDEAQKRYPDMPLDESLEKVITDACRLAVECMREMLNRKD